MADNAYLMTIGCVIAMVVGCALYTRALQAERNVQAAAGAPEIMHSAEPSPHVTPLPTIAPLIVRPTALVQRGGAWPVDGEILRAFDAQQSVYWAQLGVWQAHLGLDIAAEPGERVAACMDGKVAGVTRDALWGWRVRIEHDDRRETVYAGLEHCSVQIGESVRRGQTIGTVAQSIPCEAEMGTHLHAEMIRGGKYQDPEASLAER